MKSKRTIEELRSLFLRIYCNLPDVERSSCICVIDKEPYSWNVVKIEVSAKTKLGDKMLRFIERLGVLPEK